MHLINFNNSNNQHFDPYFLIILLRDLIINTRFASINIIRNTNNLINHDRFCFQVSQKSGIWEGVNSSSGVAEGPSRSVSHAASLDAISKRAVKTETARAPCRSLTCSVCKYTMIFLLYIIFIFCSSCPGLALSIKLFY